MTKQQKGHRRPGAGPLIIVGILTGLTIFGACGRNEEPMRQEPTPTPCQTVATITPVKISSPVLHKVNLATPEPVKEEPEALDPVEVELIGRTIWGEADGVKSEAERAAVAWCILNRVDARGQTIEEVVTAPDQFKGYRTWGECPQRHLDLAADVLNRWNAEKTGAEDVGRVLPADYEFFIGDGERNHFSIEWRSTDYWDWSLTNPYITE